MKCTHICFNFTHYFSTKVELYLPCTQRTYGSPAFPGGHLHTGLPRSLLHSAPSPHGLFTEQGSARQPALFWESGDKQCYGKEDIMWVQSSCKCVYHRYLRKVLYIYLLFGFPVNPRRQRQRDLCPLGVQSVLVPHVLSAHGSNLYQKYMFPK